MLLLQQIAKGGKGCERKYANLSYVLERKSKKRIFVCPDLN